MAQKSFWILQKKSNKNKEGAFLLKKTIKKIDFIIIGSTTFKRVLSQKIIQHQKVLIQIFSKTLIIFGKEVKKLCNYYQEWVKLDVIRNN